MAMSDTNTSGRSILDDVDASSALHTAVTFAFPTSKGCRHHFQRVGIVVDNQDVNAGKTLLIAEGRDRLPF